MLAIAACTGGHVDELAGDAPADTAPPAAPTATQPAAPQVPPAAQVVPLPFALEGCAFSDYAARVRLGDNQSYALIVDTGSATLAVAATSCSNCAGISPTYTPGTSARDDMVAATAHYGGGNAWRAEVYNDTVSLGDPIPDVDMALAAIVEQSDNSGSSRSFFNSSVCHGVAQENTQQGILGLGAAAIAAPHTDAFVEKLAAAKVLPDVFAAQFCDLDGLFWMGGWDPNRTTAAPRYTPMTWATGFYEVNIEAVLVGDVSVGLEPAALGAAVVDTGTSALLCTDDIFAAITQAIVQVPAFARALGENFFTAGDCTATLDGSSRSELDAALPTIALAVKDAAGATWSLPMRATDSYLMAMSRAEGLLWCPGIASDLTRGSQPFNILWGNSFMHPAVTIFDRAGARLGLAPQRGCPRLSG